MNLEEINKWLDNQYGCSYTRLEELHDWLADKDIKNKDKIDKLKNRIHALEKHNKKLQLEAQKYFDLLMECEYGSKK